MKIKQPVVAIFGVALAVLLLALILPEFRRNAASLAHPDPVGPTVYSKSAIGHAAFRRLLEETGFQTAISESGSGGFVSRDDVLVIAEPRSDEATLDDVRVMLTSGNVVLVLPKRKGSPDPNRPNWLGKDELLANEAILPVLRLVDKQAELVRGAPPSAFSGGYDLRIDHPQLVRSKLLTPVIASPEGILAGELRTRTSRILVLSDPDLIANHGLTRGDHAAAARALIAHMMSPDSGTVVFDEFSHGFSPSPLHLLGILFQFPFILITAQIAFAAVLLAWASAARFGQPAASPPPIEAGKATLIDTGARLLANGRHTRWLSDTYFDGMIRDTGHRLRAPGGLSTNALLAWLAQIAGAPSAPTAQTPPQLIWTWRNTLLGESRSNTQPHRRD